MDKVQKLIEKFQVVYECSIIFFKYSDVNSNGSIFMIPFHVTKATFHIPEDDGGKKKHLQNISNMLQFFLFVLNNYHRTPRPPSDEWMDAILPFSCKTNAFELSCNLN